MTKYNEVFTKMCELDYEDLEELLKDGITQFKIKAYGEGYEQGKIDAETGKAWELIAKAGSECGESIETPQQKRDRIVEQAKKDVEELRDSEYDILGRVYVVSGRVCDVKFIVNKKKRTVVALLNGVITTINTKRRTNDDWKSMRKL